MIFITLLTLFAIYSVPLLAQSNGLRVSTQVGDIVGTFSSPSVRQFLGIPYARAGRFNPPTFPVKLPNVSNASSFGDSCFQMLTPANIEFNKLAWTFGNTEELFVPMSEDCLTLNIWSPSLNRKQKTAVLFWIHGGGFNWGTSRLPIYDGANLVRDNDDITLVSINYRLGVFGQPNAPQLDIPGKPQNLGFLDVDAAIQWVFDNIANFGGDPGRITLFGQSAGSAIIDAFAYANLNDKRVNGLIGQSGTALAVVTSFSALGNNLAPRINTTSWNALATAVGCGSAPTATQFTCMQNAPAKVLSDASVTNNIAFNPIQDDVTFFHDVATRAQSGKFLKVPFLVGDAKNEFEVFSVSQQLLEIGHVNPVLEEVMADMITSLGWTCETRNSTLFHLAGGAQMFRYQYQATFPNLTPDPTLKTRAFHDSEISLVFGNYNQSHLTPTLPDNEVAFSRFVQSVWVEFARDPQNGLTNILGWEKYNPNTASIAQLGNGLNATGITFTSSSVVDEICDHLSLLSDTLAAFSALPGGT